MSSTLTRSSRADLTGPDRRRWQRVLVPEARWAGLAVALFAVGGLLQLTGAPTGFSWLSYLACYAVGGWEPGLAGLRALRERTLDVDLLMIVAAIVAAAIGQVLDGALLIIIFATSGALEALATKRTRDSVTALLDLAPDQACHVATDGTETVVQAADLDVDDVIRVRPGERIGADGVVVDGRSDVDQASITGEPLPAVKQPGAEVFAGTMNGTGALLVRVSRRAEESVVARIVSLVEQASETKAKTQLFIERIEQRYSIGMVTATLGLFFVPLALGSPLQPTLLRAITFMIVASPCAIVLATMPPLLSAIANAGRHGVLVKSAVVMEQLGATDTVAFDKTGTLTVGAPQLIDIQLTPTAGMTRREVLVLAAAAELPSQHPLAAAIVAAARAQGGDPLPRARDFVSVPGRGVSATVAGRQVSVTAPQPTTEGHANGALAAVGIDADVRRLVHASQQHGDTAVIVLVDGTALAVISLADELRSDARQAVARLGAAAHHPLLMLTGDNRAAAERLAGQVGISDVYAELLPEGKVEAIQKLSRTGRRVLLVGDGVNDAPAMAAAHLGVAMGRHGSDLALETADAVIVRDELSAISRVIALSRRARGVVVANLVIAAAVITSLVIWDLAGTLPLPLGVAGHEGSTVIVGLNGLRLLRDRAW